MCGIIGYLGKDASKNVIEGLEKLEYRGYDSAGIAIKTNNDITIFKDKGRVNHLKELININSKSDLAIGHTRWATHGEANQINAHPHTSYSGRYIIVHNGVIENYKSIKYSYLKDIDFISKTDTEVIANLIDYFSKSYNTIDSIRKAMTLMEGSYAVLLIDKLDLNKIYFFKNKSPLVISKVNNEFILASDILAMIDHTNSYYSVSDSSLGYVSNDEIYMIDLLGNKLEFSLSYFDVSSESVDKGLYEHYMLKEISESPEVIRRILSLYYDSDGINIDYNIIKLLQNADHINIVASGTSMYASMMTKYFFEKYCSIPSEVFCASELVYSSPIVTKNPVYLFLSQSGETADSITVLKKIKGIYPVISMTNSVTSSIARLSDYTLNLCAGREIAVASTKTYTAEIALSAILAFAVRSKADELKEELLKTADIMDKMLINKDLYIQLANRIYNANSLFYMGRGIDYWVCMEAALKLKEVSYIHAEAYPSGELKHGPIALVDENTPIISIITQEGTNPIVRVNIKEVRARNANTYVISMETLSKNTDDIVIPNVIHYLTPLVTGMVVQLIAYYTAKLKNTDIDKPKNLAKCVTVE